MMSDGRSQFAYRMLRSAAAVMDLADGLPITDRERPIDLVEALHRTARIQAVKCVPRRARSRPTPAMTQLCPTFLLADELKILRPRFVLTLGVAADAAIARLPGYEYLDGASSEYLWRHRLASEWGATEVFAIHHPAAPGGRWHRGHRALLDSLSTR